MSALDWTPNTIFDDLTCKRGSVGQSEGLSIPRSSVRFRLKPDTSNSHEFELHRPSNKGTKLLLKVIKAIIIIKKQKRQKYGHQATQGLYKQYGQVTTSNLWDRYGFTIQNQLQRFSVARTELRGRRRECGQFKAMQPLKMLKDVVDGTAHCYRKP